MTSNFYIRNMWKWIVYFKVIGEDFGKFVGEQAYVKLTVCFGSIFVCQTRFTQTRPNAFIFPQLRTAFFSKYEDWMFFLNVDSVYKTAKYRITKNGHH